MRPEIIHFECDGNGWPHHVSEHWGPCRRTIEVLIDQNASRQIDVYSNGHILKYDREHPREEFGYLIGLRFSQKDKWSKHFKCLRLITAEEFDVRWHTTSRNVPTA